MLLRQYWGCRTTRFNDKRTGTFLENVTKEGESPVQVSELIDSGILSSAGHVKPCVNLAGPSAKAKYY